jgi:hypothetical protein
LFSTEKKVYFDSDGGGVTLPLAAFDSAVFDGDDAEKGRKKTEAAERKRERENEKRKKVERENIIV